MRLPLICSIITTLLISVSYSSAQSDHGLSQNLASGLAEFRKDIFERKQDYIKRINIIVADLDSSAIAKDKKDDIRAFIKNDIQTGRLNNSMALYDLLPEGSPFKNKHVASYIMNNQDYAVDKALIAQLTTTKILKKDGKINPIKMKEMINDFGFLGVAEDDKILLYDAWDAQYAMLLGYTFENIELTIHNTDLYNHYAALDRADRYPNINNGNLIEFIHKDDTRIMIKGEAWDKIVIRDSRFLDRSIGYILKSLHDNITDDGHLYIYHDILNKKEQCKTAPKEEKVIKLLERSDFELVDKVNLGCQMYFKFKSIKE